MKQPTKPLTPDEKKEETEIEERRIALFDATLAALAETEREKLFARLDNIVTEAVGELFKKLKRWEAIPEPPSGTFKIEFYLMTSDEARNLQGFCAQRAQVPFGISNFERSIIMLLKHLAFAPKEVIRSVVVHEALHLLYPLAGKGKEELAIRNAVKWEYPPEAHQEEEWVRRMVERVCGKDDFLLAWQLAVEMGGIHWRDMYYKIKKAKYGRQFDDYASPDPCPA